MLLLGTGLLAATLSGCGRKGGLEPPPDPSVKAAPPSADGVSPLTQRPKHVLIKPPQQPFILDPLL